MNVLVDSSLFANGLPESSGHGRIWSNLLRRVPSSIDIFCNCRVGNLTKEMRRAVTAPPIPMLRPYRLGYKVADWMSHLISRTTKLDLLAPSLYVPQESTLQLAKSIPLVTILDDLTPELVPGTMSEWVEPKRRTLEVATIVVCISESTKNLAVQHYGLPESKFRVAPLACDLRRPAEGEMHMEDGKRYFLTVGNRGGYKNFDLTLQAFAKVAPQHKDVVLLLAGPALAPYEHQRIRELDIVDRVRCIGKVADHELAKLYAGAIALVYPSISEGFGVPPLEAMTCGTVAIVSNCTSMPEVVGDAGLQVDPKNVESLSTAMSRVLEDECFRSNLVGQGIERAKTFSWERTARLVFGAWQEAAGDPPSNAG